MRTSLKRWLLQRDRPKQKPLAMRTSWHDFAGRMHEALALDMAIELGDVKLADVRRQQQTRPLPTLHNAPTVVEPSPWWQYECATSIDQARTAIIRTV